MKLPNFMRHFAILSLAIGSLLTLSSFAPNRDTTTQDNDDLELLKMVVEEMQSALPMDLGAGMIISEVYITSSNFVMEYTCSDNMMDLLSLNDNEDYAKAEFMTSVLSDESSTLLLTVCADANLGARFIFTDRLCNRRLKIEYSVAELNRYVK